MPAKRRTESEVSAGADRRDAREAQAEVRGKRWARTPATPASAQERSEVRAGAERRDASEVQERSEVTRQRPTAGMPARHRNGPR